MAFLSSKILPKTSALRTCCFLTVNESAPSWHIFKRCQSDRPVVHTQRIDPQIRLKLVQRESESPRPLILLYGWMLAKDKHLDKYADFYNSKGFDVLTLQLRPKHILLPFLCLKMVDTILDLVERPKFNQSRIMVHGLSVGGYVHGEMSIKMQNNQQHYQKVIDRIQGQIFDSVTDFDRAALGLSSVMVKSKINQILLHKTIQTYMLLLYPIVTRYFKRSSRAFHGNWMKLPSLMLYSKTDPIGTAERIELVIARFKKMNIPVSSKCWEDSPHVTHYPRHPEEYEEACLAFMETIGMFDTKTGKIIEPRK